MTTTITGQQFNRDASGARRAAASGPVFITDRGRPAHVLLAIADYQSLSGQLPSIVDLLAMPGGADIEFELPARQIDARRLPPDLDDDSIEDGRTDSPRGAG